MIQYIVGCVTVVALSAVDAFVYVARLRMRMTSDMVINITNCITQYIQLENDRLQ